MVKSGDDTDMGRCEKRHRSKTACWGNRLELRDIRNGSDRELVIRATTDFLNMAKGLTTTSEERRLQIVEKVHAEERRSGCRVEQRNLIF